MNLSNTLIQVHFRRLAVGTVMLPLFSFIFCVIWSLIHNFKSVTATHCKVWNFLPSISAAIGSYTPQIYVWRMGIALHSAPRLLVSFMYRRYYHNLLADSPGYQSLGTVAFVLNVVENLCLLGLTNISSSEDYPAHEKLFCTFVISSSLYMLLSVKLPSYIRRQLTPMERKSLKTKKTFAVASIIAAVIATYFFLRHNWHCEAGMYSMFALSEYIVVLSNMGFHMTAYWDFHDQELVLGAVVQSTHRDDKTSLLDSSSQWLNV
ncbi:post-GPI attachment to proteins factor 2-like [Ornithodoros turicata]|uniref:post-GPI attachment to proteins factor 2-like n=1 Tax=Ornithodoros turicata TaxID=34597 RepID=UPI00313A215B